ncbi:Helix-turn-helix domain containing protein [uncultured Caudovirales phage]|uniref:Helix-turn-helix domain containing protein n=1 Tax=uncultured Caudovirales phage TaxID=2100421 RepID=A0A6J5MX98_9CAUD|nr:Helix-turn-helix domain containing protein [uncultured Caudovirales phage]
MDLNVMVAIRDDRTLPTGYHKAVLYAIASRGNQAYPNQQQLMKDSGIGSRNTLVKIVNDLEGLGWLIITKKKHGNNQYKNNRYSVQVPNMTIPCITSDETIVKSDTLKINKDKRKINISIKNNKSEESWNHSSLSDWMLPVSGINKGIIND